MNIRTLPAIALIAVLALVAGAGLTVIVGGGDTGPGDDVRQNSDLMDRIHRLGQHLHGGSDHHAQIASVIDRLQLTPDQMRRMERVHDLMRSHGGSDPAGMARLHGTLVTQYEQGTLNADELHALIDDHLEQVRALAHGVTDELVGLLGELDDSQRATLLEHLRQVGGPHGAQSH